MLIVNKWEDANGKHFETLPFPPGLFDDGWVDLINVESTYKIGNKENDDKPEDPLVDDTGYSNDLVDDDDENSYPDDLQLYW